MFADGTIRVIKDEDGELYINMFETVMHLINSATAMYEQGNPQAYTIADTMRVIASTMTDLAMLEYGKAELSAIDNLQDAIALWESNRE